MSLPDNQPASSGLAMPLPCVGRPAEIAVDQIRAVSKTRLGSRIGSLSDDEVTTLRRLITEMFGE
jgi:mRNA interferase MazF